MPNWKETSNKNKHSDFSTKIYHCFKQQTNFLWSLFCHQNFLSSKTNWQRLNFVLLKQASYFCSLCASFLLIAVSRLRFILTLHFEVWLTGSLTGREKTGPFVNSQQRFDLSSWSPNTTFLLRWKFSSYSINLIFKKKVVLRERNRLTTHRVASAHSAVLSWGSTKPDLARGGYPIPGYSQSWPCWGYPNLTCLGATPTLPGQGTPLLTWPSQGIPNLTWPGGTPTWPRWGVPHPRVSPSDLAIPDYPPSWPGGGYPNLTWPGGYPIPGYPNLTWLDVPWAVKK